MRGCEAVSRIREAAQAVNKRGPKPEDRKVYKWRMPIRARLYLEELANLKGAAISEVLDDIIRDHQRRRERVILNAE